MRTQESAFAEAPTPCSDWCTELGAALVHGTQAGSSRRARYSDPSLTAFHSNRSRSQEPLAGLVPGPGPGGGAAPHTGNGERRASSTAESSRLLPSTRRLCFVTSNRKRCQFRPRRFKPGLRPRPLPRAGEGREGTPGPGEEEARTGRSWAFTPSSPPSHLPRPRSPRDLVGTPRPERSASRSVLTRRSAPAPPAGHS